MILFCLILIQTLGFSIENVENTILNEIIIENNGTLPEPFPVLKQKVKEKLEKEYGLIVDIRETEFDGRSIDAKHDNHKFRRKVVSFTIPISGSGTLEHGTKNVPILMLGYAPTANQVEAITLNRDTGKYDFSVKHQYGPGAQFNQSQDDRYFKKEQICTSCHQAKAPIFSRSPWTETPFAFDSKTHAAFTRGNIEAIKENYNLFTFANGEEVARKINNPILPAVASRDHLAKIGVDALAIDSSVRNSNELNQISNICSEACKGNDKCERLLFALSVSKKTTDQKFLQSMREELKSLLQWNETNYAYASSVLPDRDPYKSEEQGGSIAFDTDSTKIYDEETTTRDIQTNQEIIGLNNSSTNGKIIENPGSPISLRPLINPISPLTFIAKLEAYGAMACFGMTDEYIASAEVNPNALKEFVETGLNQNLLSSYRGRASLLQAWKEGTEGIVVCESCNKQPSTSVLRSQDIESVGELFGIAKEAVKKDSPQNYFQEFCSTCHSAGALKLPLEDVQAMRRYVSPRGTVRDRLQREEMPFRGSQEAQKLTPEIRKQMIEMLE